MKKIEKILVVFSVLPIGFYGSLFFQNSRNCSNNFDDRITVNHNVQVEPMPEVLPLLELKAGNISYDLIEREIDSLKRLRNNNADVSLDDNKHMAPTLYRIIKRFVDNFATRSKIDTPKLFLYVGNDNRTYNASAQSDLITRRTTTRMTRGKKIETSVKEEVMANRSLVLGEGTVRLLLWKGYGDKLLSAIIAHEIGHMCDPAAGESKRAEYFADSKAVEFLGKRDARYLTQAINMITLATHVYNILKSNSSLLRLNMGDSHQIIRIIANSIVNELPELGDLGRSSTHQKFGYVVNNVFQDSLKYSLDPKVGMTEKGFISIYNRLKKACTSLSEYMGNDLDQEISQRYEFIESYTNQLYNHITHPTPLERVSNIERCISRLA
jgi:hypothetical protein